VANKRHRRGENRILLLNDTGTLQGPLPYQRADRKPAVRRNRDRIEILQPVNIDDDAWPRQSQIHQWHQALSAGEDLRLIAMAVEQIQSFFQL
jgi:predicted transposase YdaD